MVKSTDRLLAALSWGLNVTTLTAIMATACISDRADQFSTVLGWQLYCHPCSAGVFRGWQYNCHPNKYRILKN